MTEFESSGDLAAIHRPPLSADSTTASLLDVRRVAEICGCSARHIYRLSDSGKMPSPIRLGSLVRWRRTVIDAWLAGGCQPVRGVFAKGGRS